MYPSAHRSFACWLSAARHRLERLDVIALELAYWLSATVYKRAMYYTVDDASVSNIHDLALD